MEFNPALIDFRAEHTRLLMRCFPQRDIALGRLALHMSEEEQSDLMAKNPDTLGHNDVGLRKGYWDKFVADSASDPYKAKRGGI